MQVLSSYKEEGFDFLVKVFNSSDHLEQLTGLTLLYSAADQADVSRMQVCMSAWGGRVCGGECVHCAMHAGAAQCTMQWTCHAVDVCAMHAGRADPLCLCRTWCSLLYSVSM